MGNRETFAGMDDAARRFYSRIFTTALFNIYAVRNRLFGELLCESDDPMILRRWDQAEPLILEAIMVRNGQARRSDD